MTCRKQDLSVWDPWKDDGSKNAEEQYNLWRDLWCLADRMQAVSVTAQKLKKNYSNSKTSKFISKSNIKIFELIFLCMKNPSQAYKLYHFILTIIIKSLFFLFIFLISLTPCTHASTGHLSHPLSL
jgi:hypothetical protein